MIKIKFQQNLNKIAITTAVKIVLHFSDIGRNFSISFSKEISVSNLICEMKNER